VRLELRRKCEHGTQMRGCFYASIV
jgi:hypothetical protein